MAGLAQNGFDKKRFSEIRDDLEDKFRNEFGDGIRTSPRSRFGVLIAIVAGMLVQVWELAGAVYHAFSRTSAEGVHLENLAGIIGLTRLEATRSTVDLKFTGDAGTTIPAGSTVSHKDTGEKFDTLEDATLDNNGEAFDVPAQAQNKGPIEAVAGTLTQIETPVTGWDTVTNILDADVGRPVETDAQLRIRMTRALALPGSSTPDSLKAKLEELPNVTGAIVIENTLSTTDSDGRPGHTFEAVVDGGADEDIANKIWSNKPIGIRPVTTKTGADAVTYTIETSEGEQTDIDFSRPDDKLVILEVTVTRTSGGPFSLTQDRKDTIEDALLEEIAKYERQIGLDVQAWRFEQVVSDLEFVRNNTEHIRDIEATVNGGDTVTVDRTHKAFFDSQAITITESTV